MPYSTNADLPARVKDQLPEHAREIFRAAFNRAWSEYEDHGRREAVAFSIAWEAVKRAYVKSQDGWRLRTP